MMILAGSELLRRIAETAQASGSLPGVDFIDWASAHGWKYGRRDAEGRLWAWCAMSASRDVYVATEGRLTLALGLKPARSRFLHGNASVPQMWTDALSLGIVVPEPRVGLQPLIEVRGKYKDGPDKGKLKPWPGRPGHIGRAVVDVTSRLGRITGYAGWEGNYGGRNKLVERDMRGRATERTLGFIDMSVYAARIGIDDPSRASFAPEEVDDSPMTQAELAERWLCDEDDVLAMVDGEATHCRRVAEDVDGRPLLIPCGADGEPVVGAKVSDYEVVGCWAPDDA